jgi:hypothetical protein
MGLGLLLTQGVQLQAPRLMSATIAIGLESLKTPEHALTALEPTLNTRWQGATTGAKPAAEHPETRRRRTQAQQGRQRAMHRFQDHQAATKPSGKGPEATDRRYKHSANER